MTTKNCKTCQAQFEITQADLDFYQKVSPSFKGQKYLIPSPTLCPDCRQQRRLAWRNQTNVYINMCSGTKENIFTAFNPQNTFPVYKNDYWYSDNWDPKDYGRDFDFNRPFFEQYAELIHSVPQMALSAFNNENCDYTNQIAFCNNCYLTFESEYNENCYYSSNIWGSNSSMDCLYLKDSELCYQCLDCTNCYKVQYSRDSENCSDSYFLKNCVSCKNCFGCVNLKGKEYHFYNQPLSKEEYEKKIAEYDLGSYRQVLNLKSHFKNFCLQFPNKHYHGKQNENCTGDYLYNNQNCESCFDVNNSQDCKYVYNTRHAKNVQDMTVFGHLNGAELCYENHSIGNGSQNILFSDDVWLDVHDIIYSRFCLQNSHNLFGCAALRHSSYCILNKQYTKEEYEELVPRIIEHMKKTGEWGEFMPAKYSVYSYNETEANDYFPLSREEALAEGYKWYDKSPNNSTVPENKSDLADNIKDVDESILGKALTCETSGRKYKIIPQELQFYKDNLIPLPHHSFFTRYTNYISQRNTRTLHQRNCAKCQAKIQTTYSSDKADIVYCEQCYLDTVY